MDLKKTMKLACCFDFVIYQTRETAFHQDIQNTEKRIEKTTRSGVFFEEIRGVWIADETLSRVFDVPSQSRQKLRSKWRGKIAKIYAY